MIRTIWWQDGRVHLLDQRALPEREEYLVCVHYGEVVDCLRNLAIRGAPAIGVATAMGVALGMQAVSDGNRADFDGEFKHICDLFSRARPTARNLFWAIERMKECHRRTAALAVRDAGDALVAEALLIAREDVAANMALGRHGQELLQKGDVVLTICNAGALATAGYGTALGIVRAARENGKDVHVYACETRPVLQGARLTAWELAREGFAVTLITDGMAGWVMRQGRVNCVIVGADRVAANGDTANKIGTYSLAVLAKEHGLPFYVAAPLATIDLATDRGDQIVIEQRNPEEVVAWMGIRTAPRGIEVYNPAFDVTPHGLITAIITERGIVRPDYRRGLEERVKKTKESGVRIPE